MKSFAKLICLVLLLQVTVPESYSQPKLWGNLPYAGKPGAGLVYEFNLDGKVMSDIHAFEKFEGENSRNQLLLASNNKL